MHIFPSFSTPEYTTSIMCTKPWQCTCLNCSHKMASQYIKIRHCVTSLYVQLECQNYNGYGFELCPQSHVWISFQPETFLASGTSFPGCYRSQEADPRRPEQGWEDRWGEHLPARIEKCPSAWSNPTAFEICWIRRRTCQPGCRYYPAEIWPCFHHQWGKKKPIKEKRVQENLPKVKWDSFLL